MPPTFTVILLHPVQLKGSVLCACISTMSYACSTFVVYILHLIAELDESSACDVPTGALCDHIGEGLELVDTNQ